MNDQQMVLDAIDRFLDKDVRPVAKALEQADEYPHDIVSKMRDLGLFGATIGEQYGGLGLSATVYAKIVERGLQCLDVGFWDLQFTPNHVCSDRTVCFGIDERTLFAAHGDR